MGRKTLLLAIPSIFFLMVHQGGGVPAKPVIRVGVGMSVDEFKARSTYNFKDAESGVLPETERHRENLVSRDWVITEPYSLALVYKGHELKRADIGGDNYLTAITTTSGLRKIIEHVQITFQNHALTLDEALAEAKDLNDWFTQMGFRPHALSDKEPGRVVGAFHIEGQEQHALRYSKVIGNYKDARTAFLDPDSKIIGLTPFELEADDAYVGLEVINARRKREDVGAEKNESKAATEHEYFLNFSMTMRPMREGGAKR